MGSKLLMRLSLVIVVVIGAIWLSFFKPTKLGLDLKGGVYVVLEAVPDEGVTLDDAAMKFLVYNNKQYRRCYKDDRKNSFIGI